MAQVNWKKDDVAVFIGYTDANIAEADKLLQPGDRVRIHSVDKSGSMAAVPIVAEGEDPRDGDTVFTDEIVTVDEWEARVTRERQGDTGETVDVEAMEDAEAAAAPNKAKAKETVKKLSKKAKQAETVAETEEEAPKAKAKGGKKAKEAQAEVQETLPAVLEVAHSSSVQSLLAEKDALEAAKELVNRSEETDFTLGGVLAHIQREGIHQTLGYSGKRGFEDYIEQELGVKYRKAMYLIRIYTHFNALGIDEGKLAAMGWSKAKELVGVATKENFDELAEYAQNNTRDALIEHIKSSYVTAGDGSEAEPKAKLTRWTFSLFDDQNTTVNRAIEAAKIQASTDNISQALEYICAEWSLMSENQQTTLEEQIELLQARYNVTLTVSRETQDGQLDVEDVSNEQAA